MLSINFSQYNVHAAKNDHDIRHELAKAHVFKDR